MKKRDIDWSDYIAAIGIILFYVGVYYLHGWPGFLAIFGLMLIWIGFNLGKDK